MPKRFKKFISTDKFSFFIRYFAVFTLIFGLMTAIIFQLMRSTMYQTSDDTLARIKDAPALVVGFAVARTYEPNSEFIVQDDRYDYIQDKLEEVFSYHYSNYEHPYIIKYIEKELFNQINNLKQNTLNNFKCNNIKIDSDITNTTIDLKNETNHLNLDLKTYSSISSTVLNLLDNKYFNQIILDEYVPKCHYCNTSKSKLHTLKFINNIYNIPIYLCDIHFKEWSNKCNNNRVKKCNDIKNS